MATVLSTLPSTVTDKLWAGLIWGVGSLRKQTLSSLIIMLFMPKYVNHSNIRHSQQLAKLEQINCILPLRCKVVPGIVRWKPRLTAIWTSGRRTLETQRTENPQLNNHSNDYHAVQAPVSFAFGIRRSTGTVAR
jgi:hypothetical protein